MDDVEPYVQVSSATVAAPTENVGGSMETNFTHSDITNIGNTAVHQGLKQSPVKQSG